MNTSLIHVLSLHERASSINYKYKTRERLFIRFMTRDGDGDGVQNVYVLILTLISFQYRIRGQVKREKIKANLYNTRDGRRRRTVTVRR